MILIHHSYTGSILILIPAMQSYHRPKSMDTSRSSNILNLHIVIFVSVLHQEEMLSCQYTLES